MCYFDGLQHWCVWNIHGNSWVWSHNSIFKCALNPVRIRNSESSQLVTNSASFSKLHSSCLLSSLWIWGSSFWPTNLDIDIFAPLRDFRSTEWPLDKYKWPSRLWHCQHLSQGDSSWVVILKLTINCLHYRFRSMPIGRNLLEQPNWTHQLCSRVWAFYSLNRHYKFVPRMSYFVPIYHKWLKSKPTYFCSQSLNRRDYDQFEWCWLDWTKSEWRNYWHIVNLSELIQWTILNWICRHMQTRGSLMVADACCVRFKSATKVSWIHSSLLLKHSLVWLIRNDHLYTFGQPKQSSST